MYIYKKGVAKFLPWDIEGLALVNKGKSYQLSVIVPLLFPIFPCFPFYYLPYLFRFFLSPFEVPLPSTESGFSKEA